MTVQDLLRETKHWRIQHKEAVPPKEASERACIPREMLLPKERAAITTDIQNGRVAYIYFICNSEQSVMKIGYARNVEVRLSFMQTSTHVDLFPYYQFRSALSTERVLHRWMDRYRIRKEWFAFESEMSSLIECLEDYDLIHRDEVVDADGLQFILDDWWRHYGRLRLPMRCDEACGVAA